MTGRLRTQTQWHDRRAFSMVESLVSMLLVAGVLVAALNTVGASTAGQCRTADRAVGHLLAQDLMAEILVRVYEDPDDPPVFGWEGSENAATRAFYDDVDDYDQWTAGSPQRKDGTAIPGFVGWRRQVDVVWADPNDLTTVSVTPTDVKRIRVTVEHNDITVAELVGIRTKPLPPPQPGPTVLFVVTNPSGPTGQEILRITLLESWGYQVAQIDMAAAQSEFDNAVAAADVVYISEEVNDVLVGTKLKNAAIGVVNEDPELTDEMGFFSDRSYVDRSQILIDANTHYITSGYADTLLTVFSSAQPVFTLDGVGPPVVHVLAYTNTTGPNYDPSFIYLDVGETMYGGGAAAGRRVQLPWGGSAFDFAALNADGQTIMKRAVEWAGSLE